MWIMWIKDFLSKRLPTSRVSSHPSITLSMKAPQGSILMLYSLYTVDCTSILHKHHKSLEDRRSHKLHPYMSLIHTKGSQMWKTYRGIEHRYCSKRNLSVEVRHSMWQIWGQTVNFGVETPVERKLCCDVYRGKRGFPGAGLCVSQTMKDVRKGMSSNNVTATRLFDFGSSMLNPYKENKRSFSTSRKTIMPALPWNTKWGEASKVLHQWWPHIVNGLFCQGKTQEKGGRHFQNLLLRQKPQHPRRWDPSKPSSPFPPSFRILKAPPSVSETAFKSKGHN